MPLKFPHLHLCHHLISVNSATSISPSTESSSSWRHSWTSWVWREDVPRCSSRDELHAVSSAVATVPYISFAPLYSDLAEADCAVTLESFKQATIRWNPEIGAQSADDSEHVKEEQKSHMIVVTDARLPLLASGESPISARVLINYELPAKKEIYTRRMATCLAADGIVINMVVGGEVVTLKNIEESSNLVIAEIPVNISEIL